MISFTSATFLLKVISAALTVMFLWTHRLFCSWRHHGGSACARSLPHDCGDCSPPQRWEQSEQREFRMTVRPEKLSALVPGTQRAADADAVSQTFRWECWILEQLGEAHTVCVSVGFRHREAFRSSSRSGRWWCAPPCVDCVPHSLSFAVFRGKMKMKMLLKSSLMTKVCKINSTCQHERSWMLEQLQTHPCLHLLPHFCIFPSLHYVQGVRCLDDSAVLLR